MNWAAETAEGPAIRVELWNDKPDGDFAVLGEATLPFPKKANSEHALALGGGELTIELVWSPAFDESYRTRMELYKRVRANYVKSVDAVDPEEAAAAEGVTGQLSLIHI